jgi:hypothetical protein
MTNKSVHLIEQRENLISQAAAQRSALAQAIEPWRMPLARVDQGLVVLRTIQRNPLWLVGGVTFLTVLRPYRVAKWLRGGWLTWQMLRGLRRR